MAPITTPEFHATLVASLLDLELEFHCGGVDSGTNDPGAQPATSDAEEAFGAAFGAGSGGGTLVFDGTTYAIESAFCYLDAPVEVSTVGEGHRVLIQGSAQRPDVSIVTPGSLQWITADDEFTVAGSQITSSAHSYRNNLDDRVVEASFEIECP